MGKQATHTTGSTKKRQIIETTLDEANRIDAPLSSDNRR
jgi:hypothetical protein